MEHLPLPSSGVASQFVIGHLWTTKYDRLGFHGFLGRCGLSRPLLDQDDFTSGGKFAIIDTGHILYSWIYFGMIHEVLGDVVADFIDTRDGQVIVTTTRLNKHVRSWIRSFASLSSTEAQHKLSQAHSCLEEVSTMVSAHHKSEHRNCGWPLTPDMTLSVCLVMETLDEARRFVFRQFPAKLPVQRGLHDPYREVVFRSLEQRMDDAGWCRNQIKMCRTIFGPSAMLFASVLPRPLQRRHDLCSEHECVAYRVVDENHATKHVRRGCVCVWVETPRCDLEGVIRAGHIPLIAIDRNEKSQLFSLRVVSWRPGLKFTAISHVWSHGIGNARTTSLPTCQVERIVALLGGHNHAHGLIWLDTLCVPRTPYPLRRSAIECIRTIYENATEVMVFDEELLASSLLASTYEEALIRVHLSGWMRRLWTLHEQVRSENIFYIFSDGKFGQKEMLDTFQKATSSQTQTGLPFGNAVSAKAISLFQHTSSMKAEADGAARMAQLWSLLRWRHLSWPSDETICMANMLGVSSDEVEKLLKAPYHQRMRQFLSMFEAYPASLLFSQVPKLREDGLRWAPASWLHCPKHVREQRDMGIEDNSVGKRTSAGLVISCPHILLSSKDYNLFSNRREFHLRLRPSGAWFSIQGCLSHRYLMRTRSTSGAKTLAICLQGALTPCPPEGRKGVLVVRHGYDRTQQNVVSSGFLRAVQIIPLAHSPRSDLPCDIGLTDRNPNLVCLEGKLVSDFQSWCIG